MRRWRDFSVYVVNCFDVALAENVFSAAAASPSSLVLKYLGKQIPETTEDQFVQRPFSADFLTKVFEETKFLPFVARCLYNRLVASNSKEEPCSVERAKNPNGCTPKRGGVALLSEVFAESQRACLAERLLEWRDIRARMADLERQAICPDEKIMAKAIEVSPLAS
ncbi:hypothetical protein, conserved [Eimeria necatrix]|uniref:Uncharacterized protein n=1 Tax=Eimeria necatrix TaxID=51315 RepID=U6MQQ4_9EIME|nr:hypothetical protein, conserved [Eimeria necatrix]CDJ64804.1 hypothetical protein, conserved [Eimeria necatrix]